MATIDMAAERAEKQALKQTAVETLRDWIRTKAAAAGVDGVVNWGVLKFTVAKASASPDFSGVYDSYPINSTFPKNVDTALPDPVVITGDTTNTSDTVVVSSTTGVKVGMLVAGTGIATGSLVESVTEAVSTEKYGSIDSGEATIRISSDVSDIEVGMLVSHASIPATAEVLSVTPPVTTQKTATFGTGVTDIPVNNVTGIVTDMSVTGTGIAANTLVVSASAAQILSASITDTSTTVVLADTSTLAVGITVTGTGIPADTVIVSIDNATDITISNAATATNGAASLTFGAFVTVDTATTSPQTGVTLTFMIASVVTISENATGSVVNELITFYLEGELVLSLAATATGSGVSLTLTETWQSLDGDNAQEVFGSESLDKGTRVDIAIADATGVVYSIFVVDQDQLQRDIVDTNSKELSRIMTKKILYAKVKDILSYSSAPDKFPGFVF